MLLERLLDAPVNLRVPEYADSTSKRDVSGADHPPARPRQLGDSGEPRRWSARRRPTMAGMHRPFLAVLVIDLALLTAVLGLPPVP